jgi:capsular polysaccharide biosynthesis protein
VRTLGLVGKVDGNFEKHVSAHQLTLEWAKDTPVEMLGFRKSTVAESPTITAERPAPKGARRLFVDQDKPGVYELKKGLLLDVLEAKGEKKNTHFRGSLPHSNGIEEGFTTGPVFSIYAASSHVDINAGITFIKRRVIRESVVAGQLIDRYPAPAEEKFEVARRIPRDRIMLPLATQRMGNFCRWWLDSMSKIYVCGQSAALRSQLRSATLELVMPPPATKFQNQSLALMGDRAPVTIEKTDQLYHGASVTSSGLTYGGGQRIGAMVKGYATFLDQLLPRKQIPRRPGAGELLYLSRNDATMRKILNEDEILPGLKDLGFTIMRAAGMPLQDQIEAFRQARIVVSAHGAGLTNILFCRPGTKVVEIFPEDGVHGSAFTRLSSHLDFDYYFVVGARVENRNSKSNAYNADIVLKKNDFISFIRGIVI